VIHQGPCPVDQDRPRSAICITTSRERPARHPHPRISWRTSTPIAGHDTAERMSAEATKGVPRATTAEQVHRPGSHRFFIKGEWAAGAIETAPRT